MGTSRQHMLDRHLRARGISDPRVLDAMEHVDRRLFVDPADRELAFDDHPLPIACGQTISQPYIVAYMAQALALEGPETVLEIGAGSGYGAAVLGYLANSVHAVEIHPALVRTARSNLAAAGVTNVEVHEGDGHRGWPDAAPFDAIVLTAAPPEVPAPLRQQLREGGRLLAPVGAGSQELRLYRCRDGKLREESALLPVRFVPMTGGAGAP